MYGLALIIHTLAATIWTGGHLFLAIGILPKVLKNNDIDKLLDFERVYERVGMPALLIQVITGFYLAYRLLPEVSAWFAFSHSLSRHIGSKILLLLLTVILALIANFRIIPRLHLGKNLMIMAVLIYSVTLMSVLFVIIGLSFRLGYL